MVDKIRIGLPRALFFYDYYVFCKYFFEGLGAEVVVSQKTNRTVLQSGLRYSINELCIPIKLLYGHILDLKDRVDYIFLPNVITLDEKTYMCPKLIAAPDIIRNSMDDAKLLTSDVDVNNFYTSLYDSLKKVVIKLNQNPVKIYSVYNDAIKKQKEFEKYRQEGFLFEEAVAKVEGKKVHKHKRFKMKIAVVGHPYIINDDYLTSNLIEKLNSRMVEVVTSDMVDDKEIKKATQVLERVHHWTFANRVFGSATHYAKDETVKGIIYVTPFGCSPDSLMKENMITQLQNKKPLLTITVDEHTGEAGLITRIEAFLDMLELAIYRRKKAANKIKEASSEHKENEPFSGAPKTKGFSVHAQELLGNKSRSTVLDMIERKK